MVEKVLYGEDARQYFRNFLQMNQVDRNNISFLYRNAVSLAEEGYDGSKSNRYDYITAVGGTLYVTPVLRIADGGAIGLANPEIYNITPEALRDVFGIGQSDVATSQTGVPDWVVNTNSSTGILSGLFGGNYGLTADQTFKYAQRINGKVRTPQVISRAYRMNSLKIARGLGRMNIITGVIGTAYSVNQVVTDYQAGGWEQVNGLDVSDAAVGAGGLAVSGLVALGIVSNPVGWVVGIGTGLYFGGRLIYDLATEP